MQQEWGDNFFTLRWTAACSVSGNRCRTLGEPASPRQMALTNELFPEPAIQKAVWSTRSPEDIDAKAGILVHTQILRIADKIADVYTPTCIWKRPLSRLLTQTNDERGLLCISLIPHLSLQEEAYLRPTIGSKNQVESWPRGEFCQAICLQEQEKSAE